MLRYVNAQVTFAEVPEEISLCINLSGCPYKCVGCHSPYLRKAIGEPLDLYHLTDLIDSNTGITCVCLMGGDSSSVEINSIAQDIKEYYPNLKVGWYSGNDKLPDDIDTINFDYIKLGSYKKELGPLTSSSTNQRFYKIVRGKLTDITYKFFK